MDSENQFDAEMQFGEVERTRPRRQLRPDRNKHYATVACGAPRDGDLPIFVDLDVMRDMEAHALSDTSVELGGVLLGGQFEDREGQPFVVVTDSLRATHYESTKGSFKFTHDTWSEITRQREEFPEELNMVGWYHTHPDWGVFLSGMDMFICDNFFNNPLDVALVIDPCRDDRGMFQWTGNPRERVRRTGGFYLISSRFRQAELQQFAAQLEGQIEMAPDPRSLGYPPPPAPVVHITDSKSSWQPIAVLGMLGSQFLLLALIAWRLLLTPAAVGAPEPSGSETLRAERRMLDRIVGQLDVAPEGLVTELSEQQRLNEQLQAANVGLHKQISSLETSNQAASEQLAELVRKQETLEADLASLRAENRAQRDRLLSLERDTDDQRPSLLANQWTVYVGGGLLVALLAAGVLVALGIGRPRRGGTGGELADDESPSSVENIPSEGKLAEDQFPKDAKSGEAKMEVIEDEEPPERNE